MTRQAPLRSCGQCTRRFRSWRKDALCGRCVEDGSRRPAPETAQMADLPGSSWEDAFGPKAAA